jgi:hypothetical protein
MNLDTNKWYVKLFFWSLAISIRNTLDPNYSPANFECFYREKVKSIMRHGTDLCYFINVICIKMPFAILLNILALISFFTAFLFYPLYKFGLRMYLSYLTFVFLIIISIVLVLVVRRIWKKVDNFFFGETSDKTYRNNQSNQNIITIIKEYLKGVKNNFCLLITFKKEGDI